ncbi:MAG: metal-dependent transcriptional regulator [Cytophagales bacterium]|nr:MAG: metal-dependent transcriptional regulator [Cytophagales bacterium]
MLSFAEENYLKTIYHLSLKEGKGISNNSISEILNTKPSSVTDMLKKLSNKKMIHHVKYYGVNMTEKGRKEALNIVRKHRLWEVFLVEKLKFNWDEVHEIAEQLEHINSQLLIEKLDEFLGFPSVDPHGDPIPNQLGEIIIKKQISLSQALHDVTLTIVGLKETSPNFLKYLDKMGVYIGCKITILEKIEFDGSMEIRLENKKTITISEVVSNNILITE